MRFPDAFHTAAKKGVSGGGGGGRVKKESQLRLLSHHAVKQFNPESAPVQKRVTMNGLTCKDLFQLIFWQNSRIWKTVDIFSTALLSFTYERDKSHPRPAPRSKSDMSQFSSFALPPMPCSRLRVVFLFLVHRAKRARHAENHHAQEWRHETVEARKKEIKVPGLHYSQPPIATTG